MYVDKPNQTQCHIIHRLGAKLAAIASAAYSGFFQEDLKIKLGIQLEGLVSATADGGPTGAVVASAASLYSQLQSLPGALHVCSISPSQAVSSGALNVRPTAKTLSMISLAPHRRSSHTAEGKHGLSSSDLSPVLPVFQTELSHDFGGESCVAVRCVVPGKLSGLVPQIVQYLKTAAFLPPARLSHTPQPHMASTGSCGHPARRSAPVPVLLLSGMQLVSLSSHAISFARKPAPVGTPPPASSRSANSAAIPSICCPVPLFDSEEHLDEVLQQTQLQRKRVTVQHCSLPERSAGALLLMGRTLGRYDAGAHLSVTFSEAGSSQSIGLKSECWAVMSTNGLSSDGQAASASEETQTADIWLYRYANEAPLVEGGLQCATTKALEAVDWAEFGLLLSAARELTDVRFSRQLVQDVH